MNKRRKRERERERERGKKKEENRNSTRNKRKKKEKKKRKKRLIGDTRKPIVICYAFFFCINKLFDIMNCVNGNIIIFPFKIILH